MDVGRGGGAKDKEKTLKAREMVQKPGGGESVSIKALTILAFCWNVMLCCQTNTFFRCFGPFGRGHPVQHVVVKRCMPQSTHSAPCTLPHPSGPPCSAPPRSPNLAHTISCAGHVAAAAEATARRAAAREAEAVSAAHAAEQQRMAAALEAQALQGQLEEAQAQHAAAAARGTELEQQLGDAKVGTHA